MLGRALLLGNGMLEATLIGVAPGTQERPHAIAGREPQCPELLHHPTDHAMPVPRGRCTQAAQAPHGARSGHPPGPLCQGLAP